MKHNRIKKLMMIASMLILFNSCASQTQEDFSIEGSWSVYKYKIGSITALTIEEANLLKNQEIEIFKNKLFEFNAPFNNCKFKLSNIDIEEYFNSFKFDYRLLDLKFKGKLTSLYSCECDDSNGDQTHFEFIKNGKELIYIKDGFFFHLRKVKNRRDN
jgi:hypothetical protein